MKPANEQSAGVGATSGLRMRDLTRETGLSRETIHFYIAQGLVAAGRKTGRNTAEYGSEHLRRLQRIRDLQSKHFLPLRAIKALLEDELAAENLTPQQEALLARVRASIPNLGRELQQPVNVADAFGGRIGARELAELRDAGLVEVTGRGKAARVSAEDAEIVRAWIAAKASGLGDRGVTPADLTIYDVAMRRLVREEVKRFSRMFADTSASEAAKALENVMPVIDRLLILVHAKQVRRAILGEPMDD